MPHKRHSTSLSLSETLESVERIVRDAGAISKPSFGGAKLLRDKGGGNVVTAADLEVDDEIRSRIFRTPDLTTEDVVQFTVPMELDRKAT